MRSETIVVYRTLSELEDLRAAWRELQDNVEGATVYTSFEWLTSWWKAFHSDGEMYVVGVWNESNLVALVPLLYRNESLLGHGIRVLASWTNDHTPRMDFLVAPSSAWALDEVAKHLAEKAPRWNTLVMDVSLSGSQVGELANRLCSLGCSQGSEESVASPYLPGPASWKELEDSLSKSTRKKTKQRANRLARDEALNVKMGVDADSMDAVCKVARKSWQHLKAGTSIDSEADPKQREFYRLLALAAAARGWLRLPILELDGQAVAFQYNLEHSGVIYHLKAGFDEELGKLAPGQLLNIAVLKDMIADGLDEYDFAGNAGHHKLQWSKKVREHHKRIVFHRRASDRIRYGLLYRIKPMLKERAPGLARLRGRLTALIPGRQ